MAVKDVKPSRMVKPSPEPLPVPPWAEPPDHDEPRKVYHWRREQLLHAGYPARDASMLAHSLEVDLHQAAELLELGCAEPLALKILLP